MSSSAVANLVFLDNRCDWFDRSAKALTPLPQKRATFSERNPRIRCENSHFLRLFCQDLKESFKVSCFPPPTLAYFYFANLWHVAESH